jgi:hypothetical protein
MANSAAAPIATLPNAVDSDGGTSTSDPCGGCSVTNVTAPSLLVAGGARYVAAS